MGLFELKTEIAAAASEAASDVLLEHSLENWSVLEDAIAKRAWVVGICPQEADTEAQWTRLAGLLAAAGIEVHGPPAARALGDVDWRDSYKAHFRAWQFGRLHWVPVWERATFQLPPGDAVLWLDPGLAFGTGNHETTRLCVERLVGLAENFGVRHSEPKSPSAKLRVLDAGCGSGILALSAARLGFGDVAGFDNDPEAVRISRENAAFNELTERVTFFEGDLTSGLAGRAADVVLANIQADVLKRHARELLGAVASGGALVMSGILAHENAAVREVFEPLTNTWAVNARTMGEWSDIVLTRP
ncbi:MAG TPA: 50S ribosomal protein L11 methyltransferase [Opitutaceae bacterium]|nr:50S ribosomal protein L11 methyltransferase [Opitutaceae bacterium]